MIERKVTDGLSSSGNKFTGNTHVQALRGPSGKVAPGKSVDTKHGCIVRWRCGQKSSSETGLCFLGKRIQG